MSFQSAVFIQFMLVSEMSLKLIFQVGDKKFWAKRITEKKEKTRERNNIFFIIIKLLIIFQ